MIRLSAKMSLARVGRLVLTSLAIILGTGFLSGTFIFSDTLTRTFDRLFTDVFADVDAYVRSSSFIEVPFGGEQRSSTPISVLDDVLAVPGVADASGDIQAFARVIGTDGEPLGSENGPPTFGGIAGPESAFWSISDGRLPSGPNETVLDRATFENGGFALGDPVRVNAQSGSRVFTLVGVASYGDIASPGGATFALFDQPTASEFLLKPGLVDAILVRGDGTLSQAELAEAIDAVLDPSLRLETVTGEQIAEETKNQIGSAIGFLTTFLTVFSLIALGIGCFVIYNVFSITTAQRLRENALMRAIGASRRQVTTTIIVEAVIVGVLGSVLGFVTGIGLSRALSALLSAFGVEIPTSGLAIQTNRIVTTVVVGSLVTLVSAVLPALRAGRVPPLAALRDTAIERAGSRRGRFVSGAVLAVVGAAALVAAALDVSDWLLGLGVVGVFAAVIVLGPAIAKPMALALGAPLARASITGAMSRQNAARNPRRTAGTVAPVLIGVALVTAFSAFAASVRSEIRDVIGEQFRADYAVSAPSNGFGGLPVTLADEIAALPEVAAATGLGFSTVQLDGAGRFAQVIDPRSSIGLIDLDMVRGEQAALSATGVIVSENRATTEGWELGDTLEVGLVDGTTTTLTIEGTFVPNGFFGSYVLNRELFAGTTNSLFDSIIYVTLADGVDDEAARAALRPLSEGRGLGTLQSREEFIDAQAGQINQVLGLIYGLLALSIVIAVVGIVITLLLSVFERKREIGLLRAVGMTRNQVSLSVVGESVITSMFGAIVGVVLGIVMGLVLIVVLADDGLSAFTLPVGGSVVILVAAFVVGVAAAIYPAWRATRTDVMAAIATT